MADDSSISKNRKGSAIIHVTNFAADGEGRGLPPQNYKSLGSVKDFLKNGGATYITVYKNNEKIKPNKPAKDRAKDRAEKDIRE